MYHIRKQMHTSRSSCLLYICISKILFNVVLKNTIINKMATMKKLIISVLLLLLAENVMFSREKSTVHGYPITPVPFTAVELTDSFWGNVWKQVVRLRFHWLSVNVRKQEDIEILKWLHIPMIAMK